MELQWRDIRQLGAEEIKALLKSTTAFRRKRIESIADEDDRKRTVAGELLPREMLAGRLGVTPEQVPMDWEENGKPQVGESGFYCSISHSGPFVVCAVADCPVGVDVEVIRSADEKFIRRTCSQQEQAYIRYGDADCFRRFWECWTAKEALFKLTGKGPLLTLSSFDLPENVILDHTVKNGCTLTVAMELKR